MELFSKILESSKRTLLFFYGAIAGRKSHLPDEATLLLITPSEVSFYANTPNTIIHFVSHEREGFFRECRRHLPPKDFLRDLFDDYCHYVFVNDYSPACRAILYNFLDNSNGWKRFYKMGEGTARFSTITKFRETKDYSLLGFRNDLPMWFYEQLLQLVQFSWGPLMEHRYCQFMYSGCFQTFNSGKSIITKIVADYLSVGKLVPKTYFAKLFFDGKLRVGVVVEPAVGLDPVLLKDKIGINDIDPILQKNLLDLWIIDLICYQKDHRPGNYFIGKNRDGRCSSVSAFDNDCPTTLFPFPSVFFPTYSGIPSMFNKTGLCRVPYLNKQIVENIENSKVKDLGKRIAKYCSKAESIMLLFRLWMIKKIIHNNISLGSITLLNDDEWTMSTLQKELQLAENTYISYFIKQYVL